jgi:hypothetical protein
MRQILTTVSAAALASLLAGWPAAAQQEEGEEVGAPEDAADWGTAEDARGAGEITCRELTLIDTATVPGVLHFIAGHRAGMEEMAGMDDARAAMDEAGTADAGTERDPATDGAALPGDDAETDAAEEAAETDAAEDAAETDAAEDAAEPDAADEAAEADAADAAAEAGDADPAADGATIVQVRGFFEVPVEQTLIACSADPDARAADVIEEQRAAAENGEEEGSGN